MTASPLLLGGFMNLLKKSIAVIIAAAMLISVSCVTFFAETYYTDGDFVFAIDNDGKAQVAEYNGSDSVMKIPATLNRLDVGSVRYMAFQGNTFLTGIDFSVAKNLKTIGNFAFSDCVNLSSLTLMPWNTKIGFGAFSGCTSLQSVDIQSETTSIPGEAFLNCTSLNEVKISDSVTTIGSNAFGNCTSLKKLYIGKNVTSISSSAFKGASNLKIYCSLNSYAQQYAIENNIPYVIVDGYQIGDVNLDGTVSVIDATLLQKYIASIEKLNDTQLYLADYNNDGKVDIVDATLIQKYLAS